MNELPKLDFPVVLYDGECKFCDGFVNFLIDRDRKGVFRYAALQSDLGRKIRAQFKVPDNVDSVMLLDGARLSIQASAVANILLKLGIGWKIAGGVIKIVPGFISNFFYKIFAANRYKWFGKYDTCRIPDPHVRERFID